MVFNIFGFLSLTVIGLTVLQGAQAHATYAKIKLIKKVSGGTKKAFEFSISGAASYFRTGRRTYSTVTLRPSNGTDKSRTYNIDAGTNTITETLEAGVILDTVTCTLLDGKKMKGKKKRSSHVPVRRVGNAGFRFQTWYEDSVECTVTNIVPPPLAPPTLTLIKETSENSETHKRRNGIFTVDVTGAGDVEPLKLDTGTNYISEPSRPIVLSRTGDVTITERKATGFDLAAAICKIDGRTLPKAQEIDGRSFTLDVAFLDTVGDGENVTCVITNMPLATPTLTIEKQTRGEKPGETNKFLFDVTVNGAAQPQQFIDTGNGIGDVSVGPLPAGRWTVTEARHPKFTLVGAGRCTDQNGEEVPDLNLSRQVVSFDAFSNMRYTCRFINEVRPIVKIVKKVVDTDGSIVESAKETISFDWSTKTGVRPIIGLGGQIKVIVKNGVSERQNEDKFFVGRMTITELDPNGKYTSTVSDCSITDAAGLERVGAKPSPSLTVNIELDPGDVATCTYKNTVKPPLGPPTLKIVKSVVDSGGKAVKKLPDNLPDEFTFDVKNGAVALDPYVVSVKKPATRVVEPGEFNIKEQPPGDQFQSTTWQCTVGSESTSGLGRAIDPITLGPGNKAVCKFTNKLNKPPAVDPPEVEVGTLIIKKIVKGGDGKFRFVGDGVDETIPTKNGKGATKKISLSPGNLTITEQPAKGFKFDAVTCDAGAPDPRPADRAVDVTIIATETVTCTFKNTKVSTPTITIIRNFLLRRAEQLLGDTSRPRLIERQRRVASGSLKDTFGVDGGGSLKDGNVSYRTSLRSTMGDQTAAKAAAFDLNPAAYGITTQDGHRPGFDFWTEGRLSYFKSDGDVSGRFGVVRLGADYLVASSFLVGVLAQYDYLSEETDSYEISGQGFMVGPYAEVELTKGLYFDVKALWGKSNNEISPFRTYADEFGTTRWLAAARLTGSWRHGKWHFSPRAEVAYFSETSESYTDGTGGRIGGQTVNLGRVKVGPEISYRYITVAGTRVEPRVAVTGLWAFGQGKAQGLDPAFSSTHSERTADAFQLQFNGGLLIESVDGARIDVEGNYTGLGESRTQSVGGKVNLTIPLQSGNQGKSSSE